MMADDFDDEPVYVEPAGTVERAADPDALPARGGARAAAANAASAARPWLDQTWLNLRVWLPFLRSPDMKLQLVKYRAREQRSGMTWEIGLPKQCWECGLLDGLTGRKFDRQVRTFEAPTNVLGFSVGFAALLLLFSILFGWGWCWKAALLLTLGGGAWLAVKSWKERVRLTVWSCPAHLEELVPPGLVCHDDDLYLYAPSESLAETARAEVAAARKKQGKYRDAVASAPEEDGPATDPTGSDTSPDGRRKPREAASPPARAIPVRSELPPLKLAGEDESDNG